MARSRRGYLYSVRALSRRFREAIVSRLRACAEAGELERLRWINLESTSDAIGVDLSEINILRLLHERTRLRDDRPQLRDDHRTYMRGNSQCVESSPSRDYRHRDPPGERCVVS